MKGYANLELTKFIRAPKDGKAAYYRLAEFRFSSSKMIKAIMVSSEGQATAPDLTNFATDSVTLLVGRIVE